MVLDPHIQVSEVPVHLVSPASEVVRLLNPISAFEHVESQVAGWGGVLARGPEAVVSRIEVHVIAVEQRAYLEFGLDVDPACPVRDRDVPVSTRAGHVGRGAAAAEAGTVDSVDVPVPVDAVVEVRVDGFDHPSQLGLVASQVLGVVVPAAILQRAQPERVELTALGAVHGEGGLVVVDVVVGVTGVARTDIDLHQCLDLDVADRIVDGEAPVDLLGLGG